MPNSRVRDAHQGNRQRDGREHAKHQRVQAVRRQHFRADVFESGGMLDGLVGGHVANDPRDRRDQRIRIRVGVDEKATAEHGPFFK